MKKIAAFLMLLALFPLAQCSDDDSTEPITNNETQGNQIATRWFQALGDTIVGLEGRSSDELRNVKFTNIRKGFGDAIGEDSDNSIAHLGLAILEILELNYNSDVWAFLDSLDQYGDAPIPPQTNTNRQRTLIGRQFSLLVEIPFKSVIQRAITFPSNLTIAHAQDIVENTVLPALRRSMGHLTVVESNTNAAVRIQIRYEEILEWVVIDLGEIYLFDASVRALAAAFGVAIAYDVDFFGPDGTYNWIDDGRHLDENYPGGHCSIFEIVQGATLDTLDLTRMNGFVQSRLDSILIAVAYHNLENRQAFLTLRKGGGVLATAQQDLLSTLDKLDASVDFIRNIRDPETEENIIKLTDLTDIDASINDPDVPNFAKGFSTVEDVFVFIKTLITEPVQFTENLGPNQIEFSWTMNIDALFSTPISDFKELLPYHKWNLPSGNWIGSREFTVGEFAPGNNEWQGNVWEGSYCTYRFFQNIEWVRTYERRDSLVLEDPLQFLDGDNGNVIDIYTVEVPYFPDYTMHGVFPDMVTRDRWVSLVNILNPE